MSLKPLKQLLFTSVKCQACQRLCRPICSTVLLSSSISNRSFSTTQIGQEESVQEKSSHAQPRWKETPPKMTAPFRSKPPVANGDWPCNESQEILDQFYERVLGKGGDKMLTEDVKWLAVTHKSFDHGRRGFNDRLAFFGR